MSEPIRLLVVDDHPLLREGIAGVISREKDMELVAEAANGRDAIQCFRDHRPDVTLIDLQMPEMDGVQTMLAIRAQWPEARFLVLTTYGGDTQALRALKAGASGYLLKSAIRKELIDAIRAVHAGQRLITRQIADEIAAHAPDDLLSARELEVLARVAAGSSNKKAASELAVSEETVKAHMKSIMSKLGANDRTHAVTIALKRGMIRI